MGSASTRTPLNAFVPKTNLTSMPLISARPATDNGIPLATNARHVLKIPPGTPLPKSANA